MAFNMQIFSSKSSNFVQIVELDEISMTIRLKFNIRNESWFLSVDTEDSSIDDIRLVINFPLLRQHKALLADIPGDFFVQRINNSVADNLNYANLGTDFLLLYYTEEETTAWFDDNGITE